MNNMFQQNLQIYSNHKNIICEDNFNNSLSWQSTYPEVFFIFVTIWTQLLFSVNSFEL